MVEAGLAARWLGRILVIAWLKDDRKSVDGRADIYTEATGWRSLFGWPGGAVSVSSLVAIKPSSHARPPVPETPSAVVRTRGIKRARSDDAPSRQHRTNQGNTNRSGKMFVLIDGKKYATLPWFLGRTPIKSEKQRANVNKLEIMEMVELRGGDHNTLHPQYRNTELVAKGATEQFRGHKWSRTVCQQARPERGSLQVRLLRAGEVPGSKCFLWSVAALEQCFKALPLR